MQSRFSAAAAVAILGLIGLIGLSLTGCKAENLIRPDQPVATDTLVAYALSGTPATYPSGLAVTLRSTVRVDASGSFDVAFDFDSLGRIVVSPVRLLVNPIIPGIPSVGLQLPSMSFDAITAAPTGYYRPDTAVVVSPGQPFVVLTQRTTSSQTCIINPVPKIYAKVVIDSVKPATTRAIYLRVTTDPDCGYRSFLPGLPPS